MQSFRLIFLPHAAFLLKGFAGKCWIPEFFGRGMQKRTGYLEFYLNELSANRPMLEAIRSYVENGGKLLAECGGMMYLGRSITGMDGVNYPLVGVLAQEATMSGMRLHLGYRRFALNGTEWKGHEFYYSSIVGGDAISFSIAQQYNVRDEKVDTPVYRYQSKLP